MSLAEDLATAVNEFAATQWGEIPNGIVVPAPEGLTFGNTATRINATVLYADIRGSTKMVDELADTLAAEYYKAFLHCAAKIIKAHGGTVGAYDGDRAMGVFVGDEQARQAIRTALKITGAVRRIINPEFSRVYKSHHRPLLHTVGIDAGRLLVAKAGVRDDRDLVWVGPAANYASKLNSFEGLDENFPVRATTRVVEMAGLTSFTKQSDGTTLWAGPYSNFEEARHYRTDYDLDV